jgi:hypothetical protein
VPDACAEREEPLTDPGLDADRDMTAVLPERELAFEGVVDRLDPVADPAEFPNRGFSSRQSGRTNVASRPTTVRSNSWLVNPLSPTMISPP